MTREECLAFYKELTKLADARFVPYYKMAIEALEKQSCEDCINREKAKQFLYERLDRLNNDELYDIFSRIIDDMYNELPSVTPTHKKGKWIGKGFGFACSECGYKYDIDDYTGIGVIHIKGKYCPNCGCNMEVEE